MSMQIMYDLEFYLVYYNAVCYNISTTVNEKVSFMVSKIILLKLQKRVIHDDTSVTHLPSTVQTLESKGTRI